MNLRVGIVGAGLIGGKRADALPLNDTVVAVYDTDQARAGGLAARTGAALCSSLSELLATAPDVVIVATTHDGLAGATMHALDSGAHVLVEKPAAIRIDEIDAIRDTAERVQRLVKVGFNHRFHPAIREAIARARSGEFGPVMFMRARYGHGGRVGYDREWRANPAISGGGELIDQGMHLIDLSNALHGPLPLHSALVHTDYWDMVVDDNAVVTLGDTGRSGPWTTFHVSCSEWKNLFEFEVYAKKAKWHVSGLAGSYGPQVLRTFIMRPEMGPPDIIEEVQTDGDISWSEEWAHFRHALWVGDPTIALEGGLEDARYAHSVVQQAYEASGYRKG